MQRKCNVCGITFAPHADQELYCSKECQSIDAKDKEAESGNDRKSKKEIYKELCDYAAQQNIRALAAKYRPEGESK
jgi:endogenous inhibitor of DNA gyrase (YacG/DUF329 family)